MSQSLTVHTLRSCALKLRSRRPFALIGSAMAMTLGLSVAANAQNYAVLSGVDSSPQLSQTNANPADTSQAQISQAQISQAQADVPAIAPPTNPLPAPTPFTPSIAGITDLSRGAEAIRSLGQLRPRNVEALADDDVSWLSDVILPLYVSPGGEHYGWIYQGWLIPKGQTYLAIGRDAGFAMVRAYENLYTFPVLEARPDGWFRVQYSPTGSAWAHSSQLELGDVPLAVEGWEAQLRSQKSVYFLETDEAQALRSQPESANNMLAMIPSGSLIEPLEFQGDWMQVRVTRPASACRALTGATVTQGWMRWRGEERESLVWYRPSNSCS